MNTSLIKNGPEAVRDIALSPVEKRAMRERLMAYVARTPEEAPMLTPYWGLVAGRISVIRAHSRQFAMVLLILVLGGGVVISGAESALPGNLLYPFKIAITEPLQGIFANTPFAKASLQTDLMARRLSEAEVLATNGHLDDVSRRALQADYQAHERLLGLMKGYMNARDRLTLDTLEKSIQAKFDKIFGSSVPKK